MVIVDSHCHLDDARYAEVGLCADDVIRNAASYGVEYIQTISTTRADFKEILPIAERHPKVFCSFGIHPHNVEEDGDVSVEEICNNVDHPKVIAVGETGLDYYYDTAPRKLQWDSFERHLQAARELDVPVIIHTRDAEEDTMTILDDHLKDGPAKLLFHCFSSQKHLAHYAVEKGIYLSASGIITFKNAAEVREGFALAPLDLLLVETDAPYLAPVPHRGKLNEPGFTKHVLEKLADIKEVLPEELAKITTNNFFNLFTKAVK